MTARIVRINGREVELGGRYVGANLRESTDVAGDPETLRRRLDEDGFVLLRGLLDRQAVLDVRRGLLAPLAREGLLDPAAPLLEGRLRSPERGPDTVDSNAADRPAVLDAGVSGDWRNPKLRALTTGPALAGLFERLLGGDVVTYDYRWLRFAGPGGQTGLHWDSIFWKVGDVYSAWVPLGDVPVELGPLAVLCGAPGFRDEARRAPRGGDASLPFWSTIDPFEIMDRTGGRLETTDFRAGDVVAFTMYTPHTTLANETERVRVSVDVRFQLTSEPLDMTFMGETPPLVQDLARRAQERCSDYG